MTASLITHHLSLVAHHWLLFTHYCRRTTHHPSLVTDCLSPFTSPPPPTPLSGYR